MAESIPVIIPDTSIPPKIVFDARTPGERKLPVVENFMPGPEHDRTREDAVIKLTRSIVNKYVSVDYGRPFQMAAVPSGTSLALGYVWLADPTIQLR